MNVLRSQGRIAGASFKDGNMPLVDLYDVSNILPIMSSPKLLILQTFL